MQREREFGGGFAAEVKRRRACEKKKKQRSDGRVLVHTRHCR